MSSELVILILIFGVILIPCVAVLALLKVMHNQLPEDEQDDSLYSTFCPSWLKLDRNQRINYTFNVVAVIFMVLIFFAGKDVLQSVEMNRPDLWEKSLHLLLLWIVSGVVSYSVTATVADGGILWLVELEPDNHMWFSAILLWLLLGGVFSSYILINRLVGFERYRSE